MTTKVVRMTGGRNELGAMWCILLTASLRENQAAFGAPDPDAVIADLENVQDDFESVQDDFEGAQTDLAALKSAITAAQRRIDTAPLGHADFDDGTTDGKIALDTALAYQIGGTVYEKAIADDAWDLSAETDTIAAEYRAYWLYLDDAGAASIAAGANAASSGAAIAALPAETATKCPIGVYVAGPETDFNGAAGLAAQGTLIRGRPSALAAVGALETATLETATLETATLASDGIAAILIEDGTTPGKLKLTNGAAYRIGGVGYSKGATDDAWDLSALTDLAEDQYQAAWLYLDATGTASIAAGGVATSAARALAALPAIDDAKSVIGVYVADPEIDWNDVGGLEGQGTVHVGLPDGAPIGVPGIFATSGPVRLIHS